MSRLEVRPIEPEHVAEAGALLAARHRDHRSMRPLLSPAYQEVDAAAAELGAAMQQEHASGAVALQGGKMIGFLVGGSRATERWGRNAWVEAAGQATTEAETIRDLYALAAARWVEEDRTAHYVLVPATDAGLVDAWFRLGFGQQQVHGLRDVPVETSAAVGDRTDHLDRDGMVLVRRAVRADIPALAELDLELPGHHRRSPTFANPAPRTIEDGLAEWSVDIDDSTMGSFVAERDGVVIGSAIGCNVEVSSAHVGLARPDQAGLLAFAAVRPQARGLGAGRALGQAVLDWAAETGYRSVAVDWRATNLLSSRAWPALGFAETFLRLHRLVRY
jgi:GNAT superfamily N-acetyltransferase